MSTLKGFVAKSVAALAFASIASAANIDAKFVPGAYIVEFADPEGSFTPTDAKTFYDNLTSSDIGAERRLELNHELFKGTSFRLDANVDNETTVDIINSFSSVAKIWPLRLYSNPAKVISTFNSPVNSQGFSIPTANQKRSVSDSFSTHVMGGVDKLHDEGYTGEGLFIGVVDTGVDYNHPALGGCFGAGCKVVTGTDLVGDDFTGTEIPVPDDDPMDCGGHGTHVSGIIAALPNEYNFTGVAPNATLGMWKVFGCTGEVSSDILIQAFNLAYEAGVDLISSSIGGASGWTEEPWDVAVQRITEKGVPCILSAGNDGENGQFDTSTASESIGATSVGSIDNVLAPMILTSGTYTLDGENPTKFGYGPSDIDFGNLSAPLFAPTLDATVADDACEPFPDSTPDLSGYITLIRRGGCTFEIKAGNAIAKGATAILFYNNVDAGVINPSVVYPIPAGMVTAEQGVIFINALTAGQEVDVTFGLGEIVYSVTDNPATGGYMSKYTSWGPSYELWLKPEVSAPGGLILSTYPLAKGGYAVLSGTSMACPYIAGTVGLIMQIKGKKTYTPDQFTSLLASTGTPVNFNDGATTSDFLAPVIQQGGGLVNAYKAAYTTTFLDLDNVALNDTFYFRAAHPVTIKNTGTTAQTYTFANVIAATSYTMDTGSIFPAPFPQEMTADPAAAATIRFEPKSLTVAAGSTGIMTMHFTRPSGLDPARIPVYSGFVTINGTNGDSLNLPYGGITSRIKDAKIMDTPDGFPYLATSTDPATPVTTNGTFTLPGNGTSPDAVYPTVVYALAMGSRIVRIDVVPASVRGLPRIIGQQVLGSIPGYPRENMWRNDVFLAPWDGHLADGTLVPPGKYKLMLRALKITGDQTYDHDYERFETPFFEIKYSN